MRRVGVIINQGAGALQADNGKFSPQRIQEVLSGFGIETLLQVVPSEKIAQVTRQLSHQEVETIVAGGGDGTLSTVAGVLAGTTLPLGVLPLGTLNHFAKDLKLPLDWKEALQVIARGVPRPVDVGEVNGHIFINNSSIGGYPRAVEEREAMRRQTGQGKTSAMLLAVMKTFVRRPLLHVRLELDGLKLFRSTPFVFVGNNRYEPELFAVKARRQLDGGKLCVFTSRCASAWCLVRLTWRALWRQLEQAEDFDAWSVKEVSIQPHKKNVRVAVDGEVLRLKTPLRYRIHPGALRVMAPPDV